MRISNFHNEFFSLTYLSVVGELHPLNVTCKVVNQFSSLADWNTKSQPPNQRQKYEYNGVRHARQVRILTTFHENYQKRYIKSYGNWLCDGDTVVIQNHNENIKEYRLGDTPACFVSQTRLVVRYCKCKMFCLARRTNQRYIVQAYTSLSFKKVKQLHLLSVNTFPCYLFSSNQKSYFVTK